MIETLQILRALRDSALSKTDPKPSLRALKTKTGDTLAAKIEEYYEQHKALEALQRSESHLDGIKSDDIAKIEQASQSDTLADAYASILDKLETKYRIQIAAETMLGALSQDVKNLKAGLDIWDTAKELLENELGKKLEEEIEHLKKAKSNCESPEAICNLSKIVTEEMREKAKKALKTAKEAAKGTAGKLAVAAVAGAILTKLILTRKTK